VTMRGIWRFVVGCVWTTKWRGPDWARGSGWDGRESRSRYRLWIVGYSRLGSPLRCCPRIWSAFTCRIGDNCFQRATEMAAPGEGGRTVPSRTGRHRRRPIPGIRKPLVLRLVGSTGLLVWGCGGRGIRRRQFWWPIPMAR
jgi:hypothetical protein